jgi:hypothetical protein
MWDEVLVAGEKEERIHPPVHGLLGNVEALLAPPPEPPMADALAGREGDTQRPVCVR